jgi:hypothetical protein
MRRLNNGCLLIALVGVLFWTGVIWIVLHIAGEDKRAEEQRWEALWTTIEEDTP